MIQPPIASYDNLGGNAYDKYHTTNPIARRLMRGFLGSFEDLVQRVRPTTAFEVGCGEGYLSMRLLENGIDARGCDLDTGVVRKANALTAARGHGERFTARSVYEIAPGEISADLIVCCEMLEHVPDPGAALDVLAAQHALHWLLSVPREPIWRCLNMARGKYVADLGNTPGHIQHWSASGFRQLVERRFKVVERRTPLPRTMLLCAPRQS